VRHGSTKRLSSAVGEGSIAVRLVHEYLQLVAQRSAMSTPTRSPSPTLPAPPTPPP
jgi:hypothetical protein